MSKDNQFTKGSLAWERVLAQYRASGIHIEELGEGQIRITQRELVNGYILNQRELIARARQLYPSSTFKIIPVTFPLDTNSITPEWIREQVEYYGLKPKDLMHQLGLNQSSVSLILSGKRPMSNPMRALFYYYFLCFRLNQELRAPRINAEDVAKALERVRLEQWPELVE